MNIQTHPAAINIAVPFQIPPGRIYCQGAAAGIFLIFFILAKVKLFIISCLTSIKSIAQVNIPEQSFYMKQPRFLDCMYQCFMTQNIMKI